jgi:hypothetical protein
MCDTLKVINSEYYSFSCFTSLFNISVAQPLSACLAVIRCIKIVGKTAALFYNATTRALRLSNFMI